MVSYGLVLWVDLFYSDPKLAGDTVEVVGRRGPTGRFKQVDVGPVEATFGR